MMAELSTTPVDPLLTPAPETRARFEQLKDLLHSQGPLMVAYSGGVDSAFLAATAHTVLGTRMLAVIADSPSLARREFEQAKEFASRIGMALEVLPTDELARPEYSRNDANRCFYCKDALFAAMEALGQRRGFSRIAYGMNADDRGDYRPGQRAAGVHQVLAPLAEVGMTKLEVRQLSREAGYPLWDRPAAPCLASRIEYGRPVTREALSQVELAEDALRELGYRELRVRHHGEVARVELATAEMPRALSPDGMKALADAVKKAAFKYVALDCEGFRSGSLNAVLPVEVLRQRGMADTAQEGSLR